MTAEAASRPVKILWQDGVDVVEAVTTKTIVAVVVDGGKILVRCAYEGTVENSWRDVGSMIAAVVNVVAQESEPVATRLVAAMLAELVRIFPMAAENVMTEARRLLEQLTDAARPRG